MWPWQSATPNSYNPNNSGVHVADLSHQGIAPMCINCESGTSDTPVICREDFIFHSMKQEIFNGIVSSVIYLFVGSSDML